MKSISTIILLAAGILCLSSCSDKNSKTNNLVVIPSTDSVSKDSFFQIFLNNDTFLLKDLVVQNSPIEGLYASNIFNYNDSFWVTKLLITDYRLKQIGLNLTATNTTNPYNVSDGDFYIVDNASTLTDYSKGENKTYTIKAGSSIHLVRGYTPITGTMNLTLYYNHTYTPATGNFKIYK